MKRIAEVFDVARSRLAERMGKHPAKRLPRYSKEQDSVSLPFLREITDERGNISGYQGHGLPQPAFVPAREGHHLTTKLAVERRWL